MNDDLNKFPTRLVVVAGTYDGVLAGWDSHVKKDDGDGNTSEKNITREDSLLDKLNPNNEEDSFLKMNFAMAVHDGSIRSLSIASINKNNQLAPDTMISCGYDEFINTFSLSKLSQSGELKTPSDLGTPTCSSFAPPADPSPTHVLVGLSSGKIVIYRKKDWSVVHILAGHDDKGVTSIAVHPSGKMALSGGLDGKLNLWNLMTGRLAFVHKIHNYNPKGRKPTINDIIWSTDGNRFAFCTHQGNITARDMETGEDLLNIDLPSTARPNQITFVGGNDGLFLAAACNDGGLPVFVVGSVDEEENKTGTRRAMMAIEPLEGVATAGEERFKCIQSVNGGSDFLVTTANSGGIISLIDLEGAARMLLDDNGEEDLRKGSVEYENAEDEDDLAAEILCSVRVGTGARITSLCAWSRSESNDNNQLHVREEPVEENTNTKQKMDTIQGEEKKDHELNLNVSRKKRKSDNATAHSKTHQVEMDAVALKRARALVSQAKKHEKRKKKAKN